jgi:hypothetical protein
MKKVYKLILILIVLSMSLYSCFPLLTYSNGYRGDGYRGHGYRSYGYYDYAYRGHGEKHVRHHDRNRDRDRDRGEWSYNSHNY